MRGAIPEWTADLGIHPITGAVALSVACGIIQCVTDCRVWSGRLSGSDATMMAQQCW